MKLTKKINYRVEDQTKNFTEALDELNLAYQKIREEIIANPEDIKKEAIRCSPLP
jgi:hypothetical protein